MKKFNKEIRAYALRNAIEFGKADVSKVLPKLFQHGLGKEDVGKVVGEIKEIVKEVNRLGGADREKEFKKYEKLVKERVEEEKGLPELPGVKKGKKVVLRVAPYPSGALHLGNAKTFLLNTMYAERYKGKLILVMDDTIGSEKKPLEKESYELIKSGFKYLGIKYDKKIVYKSDRLKIYYRYAEKLIRKDKAYVCYCTQDKLRENRKNGRACGCRILPWDVQFLRWKEMFKAKEGHAILRLKTDLLHKNPAFRDRVLFKISDRKHAKVGKKYRVWPTLEMSWSIDDHLLGVTHIIRGNDLAIESDMERFIWKIFSWDSPEILHTGLVTIEGARISKSKAREEVRSGEYIGWDDPRTWSLQSLERRGILSKAVREFVEDIGLNKQDIIVPIETLYAVNRKMIDTKANRYSFVRNPKRLIIKNAPEIGDIEIPVHPDKKEERKVSVGRVHISGKDFEELNGKEIRLLHLYNIKLGSKSRFTSVENKNIQKINWVGDGVRCRVLMPYGGWASGLCESGVSKLKEGEIIQFERFGFVKYVGGKKVKGKDTYEFWFAHK